MRSTNANIYSSATTQSPNVSYEHDMMYGDNPMQNKCWEVMCCQKSSNCFGSSCGCYIRDEVRPTWLQTFYAYTRSTYWICFIYGFSMLLLFGPAIQSLIDTHERGDAVFLWFRVMMLVFFLLDIVVRCALEEDYFVLNLSCCGIAGSNNNNNNNRMTSVHNSTTLSGDTTKSQESTKFRIGSFLFWCDLISTLSILYDLSFINNHHFDTITYDIEVNEGTPNREESYRLAPNSLELNLFIVILRTGRCARFVQSRAAVDFSNKLNMYVIPSLFHSLFCSYFRQEREKRKRMSDLGDIANIMVMNDSSVDKPGVLAAAKSEAINVKNQLFPKRKDSLSGTTENEMLVSQQVAAMRIQRIWRNKTKLESEDDWEVNPHHRDPSENSNALTGFSWRGSSILASFSLSRSQGGKTDHHKKNDSTTPKSILESFAEKNTDLDASEDITPKSILEAFAEKNPETEQRLEETPKSRFQSRAGKGHNESQVGSDMRQLTGQRVAIGTLLILLCTVLCTYTESTTTAIKTMVVLHTQTMTPFYVERSLTAAISSSVPTLYEYHPVDGSLIDFTNPNVNNNGTGLTDRNKMNITIVNRDGTGQSSGLFDNSQSIKHEAMVDILATLFVIFFWFAGLISFSGPVAMLVIAPVEQMVRLLNMLSRDPLGYQSTLAYKQFLSDEDKMTYHTGWSKEVLKGMETSFLKSTILRIGSLMKVGFGSAGVQIIQNNLETGQNDNMLTLNAQGTTVSCIFLFCDIRQFTDATEQLQEEVFVFTNRIAAVVHSYCHSFGGAANKNVGDAFLVSWSLDEKGKSSENRPLRAKSNQADKALLSVIKICIALTYDNFFLEPLSNAAIGRLKTKLGNRSGPVVQIGFGLHAGNAVQGAIGSQRKIDASYVSESVERAEYLESSTKKYGLKVLMSGEFHKLLHSRNRDRCRKVDQVLLDHGEDEHDLDAEVMNLFTFDMDIDALEQTKPAPNVIDADERVASPRMGKKTLRKRKKGSGEKKNSSSTKDRSRKSEIAEFTRRASSTSFAEFASNLESNDYDKPSELILPKGPMLYSHNVWFSPEMKRIRRKYVQGELFFENYKLGLDAYYKKDWVEARKYFRYVLENFDDGPSKYFLAKIKANKGVPPEDFMGCGMS